MGGNSQEWLTYGLLGDNVGGKGLHGLLLGGSVDLRHVDGLELGKTVLLQSLSSSRFDDFKVVVVAQRIDFDKRLSMN